MRRAWHIHYLGWYMNKPMAFRKAFLIQHTSKIPIHHGICYVSVDRSNVYVKHNPFGKVISIPLVSAGITYL